MMLPPTFPAWRALRGGGAAFGCWMLLSGGRRREWWGVGAKSADTVGGRIQHGAGRGRQDRSQAGVPAPPWEAGKAPLCAPCSRHLRGSRSVAAAALNTCLFPSGAEVASPLTSSLHPCVSLHSAVRAHVSACVTDCELVVSSQAPASLSRAPPARQGPGQPAGKERTCVATLGVNDLRPPLGPAPEALLWPCSADGSCCSEVRPDLQNGLAVWGCDGGRGSMCHGE